MQIAKDCVVSIEFRLTNEKGQLLDSSPPGETLQYLHGAAGILPELERHLAGKQAGDAFDITIPPERGFGDRLANLVEIIPIGNWSEPEKLAIGTPVTRTDPAGGTQNYLVTGLDAEKVTVDGNHPLAGMTLRFQGRIVEVRPGTAEELASV